METFFPNDFASMFKVIKIVIIVFDVILLYVFVAMILKVFKFRPHFVHDPREYITGKRFKKSSFVAKEWSKVLKIFSKGTAESMRLAIIEADSMVDRALKEMGLAGEHFADRLSGLTEDDVKSIEKVWESHRLRNDLVHTPHLTLSFDEAKKALRGYRDFLKELGLLE
ncbi:MAG: hypothetical protein WC705_01440 [Candidatus Paceibacterota bacterium]|jgi:hypothetical protein